MSSGLSRRRALSLGAATATTAAVGIGAPAEAVTPARFVAVNGG